ncbi:MAG: ribosomal protein S18-alanine N-acetyltransferase [Gammaproteobacteria bacterium]|nr:ribosomal protein S18-alanine N-acetyltransferase [Gammaproteobacteria bacterium]NIR92021.1 ribosomal protein S18-alanine N-acetyltransferase [Gammaproteobacteria bacterium]NIT62861.1 ribosomal protein S18-alanine N-acetyltransferase [Gammaproteobacteria bacterium]NIV50924.1 ribosomal protein S18-alanine N-acetyltransferase [Gammaproteobacteria bacterium]NIW57431.1 ribosomal protein S18-alanine N-acetyltransferase [Gammaproteobacteria bacterium]
MNEAIRGTAAAGAPALRAMREEDLPRVLRIERETYTLPWSALFFLRALRSGWSCWVLERDEEIVGYGVARMRGDWAHIMNLCIAQRFRGRGLGARMLAHLLAQARAASAARAWLEVRPTNTVAIRLYERMGFRQKYRKRGYYPDPGRYQDALVMVCRL